MEARAGGDSESWRCFVAVELPPAVQDGLEGPLEGLRELEPLLRCNLKDRIHLTLHFLGDVARERVKALGPLIEREAGATAGFVLSVRGVGAFPSTARPRILWAGIEGAQMDRLVELHARLGRTLAAAGFTIEQRPYAPHLTLARLRRPALASERGALARWLEAWSARQLGTIEVRDVSLMRSELSVGPPRYTRLFAFPLQ